MAECPYHIKKTGGLFSSDEHYCQPPNNNAREIEFSKAMSICTEAAYTGCEIYKKFNSSGCYLTTATCNILGLEDNNLYLQIFRKFRKDYLQKNPKGLPILNEYDTVGPIIAHKLMKDEKRQEVVIHMLKDYIHPIAANLITRFDGNYDYAIKMYSQMTKELIDRYNLQTVALTIPGENKFDFTKDYSTYGRGRKQR